VYFTAAGRSKIPANANRIKISSYNNAHVADIIFIGNGFAEITVKFVITVQGRIL